MISESKFDFHQQGWVCLMGTEIENSRLGRPGIDHLPIMRKGLRRARPIPTALVTVRNQGNPIHFSETSKPR